MQNELTILDGYGDAEKGAYITAIASIATADYNASEDELAYLEALAQSAQLSEIQTEQVLNTASAETTDDDLRQSLDVLKSSDLRFSLVSDVIAFAQSDKSYSETEQEYVQKIASYLNVNQEQFSVIDQFTKTAVAEAPQQAAALESQQTSPQGFLNGLGFGDKFKNAGINGNALIKGAIGIIGPLILAKMMSGRRNSGGGMFGGGGSSGGLLGGLLGGNSGTSGGGGLLGGLFGGGGAGGGLLGGLLGGGRGFGGAGGMLGRLFK